MDGYFWEDYWYCPSTSSTRPNKNHTGFLTVGAWETAFELGRKIVAGSAAQACKLCVTLLNQVRIHFLSNALFINIIHWHRPTSHGERSLHILKQCRSHRCSDDNFLVLRDKNEQDTDFAVKIAREEIASGMTSP
jgi:hypothetical protein